MEKQRRGKKLLSTGRYKAVKPKKGPSLCREYWTPRPGNIGGASPGKDTKILTHRRERAQAKRELRDLLDEAA